MRWFLVVVCLAIPNNNKRKRKNTKNYMNGAWQKFIDKSLKCIYADCCVFLVKISITHTLYPLTPFTVKRKRERPDQYQTTGTISVDGSPTWLKSLASSVENVCFSFWAFLLSLIFSCAYYFVKCKIFYQITWIW